MPYASEKQANLMRAVANSPSFAKKVGIPQSVGKKFETHKAKGGALKESEMAESKKMAKKEISFMEKKGAPKSMIKHEKAEYGMKNGGAAYAKGGGIESKGKTKGKVVKMAMGGMTPEFVPNAQQQKDMQSRIQQAAQPTPASPVTTRSFGDAKEQADQKMREAMSGQKVGNAPSKMQQQLGATQPKQAALDTAQKLQMQKQADAQIPQSANRSAGAYASSDPRQQAINRANEQMAQQRAAEQAAAQRAQAFVQSKNKSMPAPRRPGGFASGGSVSSRGDGCAQRGKTKGRYI